MMPSCARSSESFCIVFISALERQRVGAKESGWGVGIGSGWGVRKGEWVGRGHAWPYPVPRAVAARTLSCPGP